MGEIYKGYTIHVTKGKKQYLAKSSSGDSAHGETEEDAVKWLKQKIDNIEAFRNMQKDNSQEP